MPSKTFFQIKKEAIEVISNAAEITVIDREIDILSDDYRKAQEKLEKVAIYINDTKPKLKASGFEKEIIDLSLDKAVDEMWVEAQERFYAMVEQRYSDIIKIFKNGSKESDTK
jgi:hypothetical protein